ncbi:hypothetical protein [Pengzhenrongella frigida]|uniref:Pyridoxamine 5'-phosphate oxidase putative domain-containing protein n=1 Tax=Pengzhenrongella frigida TaxID=1259133 RepID=A0A4Q5MWJ3_9MICO|nr:hypothetical protein [Cellulomonas sp. HLT2-17]RYV49950.1 hypothetical protein EUA98_16075 [Cellulomonas sp. HLT2-17]
MSARRRSSQLRLFGAVTDHAQLDWSWVDQQLAGAGTYWVVAHTAGHPYARPVWGIWHDDRLDLSLGSPTLLKAVRRQPAVTVHLESGTEVIIVEGLIVAAPMDPARITAYNRKYDWDYRVSQLGELTAVEPRKIMAWRCVGWSGRDGFSTAGCWRFDAVD